MRSDASAASVAIPTTVSSVGDYFELTKPSVVWLIVMSTAVGFYLGSSGSLSLLLFAHTLLATALLAGGTGALNQWAERDLDALMRRTEQRPLPAGRLRPVYRVRASGMVTDCTKVGARTSSFSTCTRSLSTSSVAGGGGVSPGPSRS